MMNKEFNANIARANQGTERLSTRFHFSDGSHMTAEAKADAKRLIAQLPPDTRDLTARLCGDPMPGRSALAKRTTDPLISRR